MNSQFKSADRRRALLAAAAGAASAIAGPALGNPGAGADITIAQVAPFSGPLATNGEANFAGAKAHFDEVNAQGGIRARKIRLIREDDGYKPDETVRLVKLVARRDQPSAFVCALGSASIGALLKSQALDEMRIPMVGASPGSEFLREPGSPYLFHIQAGDFAQLAAIISQLSTVGIKRIGVAYQDLPFGTAGLGYVEQLAPAKGVQVVAKAALPPGANEASQAAALLRGSNAQAYVLVLAPNTGLALVGAVRKAGDRTPIYSLSYLTARAAVEQVGLASAVGIAVAQVTPNPESMTSKLSRDFRAAMQAHAPQGTEMSALSLAGFVAASVVVEGLRRARSAAPADLHSALRTLKVDLGGLPVDFTDGRNIGTRLVHIGVIGSTGALRY
jgi:ABC-type branched-subunit amino acid transport system substrate-binding protein